MSIKCVFQWSEIKVEIKYSNELIDNVNKYNDNLVMISQRILNLKIAINKEDINIKNLNELLEKLSIINSAKLRRNSEKLLKNIIREYGYLLQIEVENMK